MSNKKKTTIKLIWMFFICSVIGIISEGSFTWLTTGHWETHVISIIIPLCPIYGLGSMIFFSIDHLMKDKNILLKSIVIGIFSTCMEFLCGCLLYYIYGMRAWDYKNAPINVLGIICPEFLFIWSVFGLCYLLVVKYIGPKINFNFKFKDQNWFFVATLIFGIFMCIDILSAFFVIKEGAERHYGEPPKGAYEEFCAENFDDEYLRNRFIEWEYLDECGG